MERKTLERANEIVAYINGVKAFKELLIIIYNENRLPNITINVKTDILGLQTSSMPIYFNGSEANAGIGGIIKTFSESLMDQSDFQTIISSIDKIIERKETELQNL